MRLADADTVIVSAKGRRVVPGLIDSHTHIIRQGVNFAMELRWDEMPSLADGLRALRAQAQKTPPGAWVRVVGGWSADQFDRSMMCDSSLRSAKRVPLAEKIGSQGQFTCMMSASVPPAICVASRSKCPLQPVNSGEIVWPYFSPQTLSAACVAS